MIKSEEPVFDFKRGQKCFLCNNKIHPNSPFQYDSINKKFLHDWCYKAKGDLTKARLFKKVDIMFTKSSHLYNQVFYPMNRTIKIVEVEPDKKSINLKLNLGKKKIITKLGYNGNIIAHGLIYTTHGNPLTKNDIVKLNKAIKILKKIKDYVPERGSSCKFLGRIYNNLGFYEEAIIYYSEALKRVPSYGKNLKKDIEECKNNLRMGEGYAILKYKDEQKN